MAPPASKRKSGSSNVAAATSPFKRLKAKVGKRAPQAANYTETSFKATSLHVSNQEGSLATKADVAAKQKEEEQHVGLLISGRGRLVSDLVHSLHHPAAAVRLSAAKGVQDIVTRNHRAAIAANLSPLLSAIGKTAVDEEEEIRHIGLAALQKLLQQKVEPSFVKPFLPLVLAFFQSALNSLDRGTRRDGLGFLHALAQNVSLSSDVVAPILPALVRIWEDKAFQSTGTKASRKKNKKHQQHHCHQGARNGKYPLLDCLVSLLLAVPTDKPKGMRTMDGFAGILEPSLCYKAGGRSKNAVLVLPRRLQRRPILKMRNLEELSAIDKLGSSHAEQATKGPSTLAESAVGLFSKLRDTLVELQQTESMETLLLLVQGLDLFCHIYGKQLAEISRLASNLTEPLHQVCQQLVNLMLEVFPIKRSPDNASATADFVNGQICLTLVHVALFSEGLTATRQQNKRSSNWLKPVVDYICHKLNDKSSRRPGSHSSQENTMSVLLSLLSSRHDIVGKVPGLEKKLVQNFCSCFVRSASLLAQNLAGETCLDVSIIIFSKYDHDLSLVYDVLGDEAFDIAAALPDLLLAWKGDCVEHSARLVQLLSVLVRKRLANAEGDLGLKMDSFLDGLRQKCELLTENDHGTSILELWTPTLQRFIVSLMVELESPTHQSLTSLSKICARSNLQLSEGAVLSSEVANFVVHSICKIRKTVQMQHFLRFLIDSTGASQLIEGVAIPEMSPSLLATFDNGVSEISKCLIQCGVERVTPMLGPLFLSLMDRNDDDDESEHSNTFLLQTRLVFAMLSLFAIDLRKRQPDKSVIQYLPNSAPDMIFKTSFDLLQTLQGMEVHAEMKDLLFAPLTTFLCIVPETTVHLILFFERLDEMDEDAQSKSIQSLLRVINHPIRLDLPLAHQDALITNAKQCESSLKGPLQQQAAELRVALQQSMHGQKRSQRCEN